MSSVPSPAPSADQNAAAEAGTYAKVTLSESGLKARYWHLAKLGPTLSDNDFPVIPLFPYVVTHHVDWRGNWHELPETSRAKAPGLALPSGHASLELDWPRYGNVDRNRALPHTWRFYIGNVGIATGGHHRIVCIDIDVMDAKHSEVVAAECERQLGKTDFVRVGLAPKIMLIYRLPEGERLESLGGKVEILADGKQFAAYGWRNDETEYRWTRYELADSHIDELPEVAAEKVREFHAWANEYLAGHGIVKASAARQSNAPGDRTTIVREVSLNHLRGVLNALSNEGLTYQEWINVGLAIHAEGGDFEDFDVFSQRVVDKPYDGKAASAQWRYFEHRNQRKVRIGTLEQMLRNRGIQVPDEFEGIVIDCEAIFRNLREAQKAKAEDEDPAAEYVNDDHDEIIIGEPEESKIIELPPFVSLAEGQRQIEAAFALQRDEATKYQNPFVAIAATVGAGKTESALRHIANFDLTTQRVVAVTPDSEMGKQWKDRFAKIARQYADSTRVTAGRDKLCSRHEELKEDFKTLSKNGLSIRGSICAVCPEAERGESGKPKCAYLQQAEDKSPGLIITPKQNLKHGQIPGVEHDDKDIAAVMIDESVVDVLTSNEVIELGSLKETITHPGYNSVERKKLRVVARDAMVGHVTKRAEELVAAVERRGLEEHELEPEHVHARQFLNMGPRITPIEKKKEETFEQAQERLKRTIEVQDVVNTTLRWLATAFEQALAGDGHVAIPAPSAPLAKDASLDEVMKAVVRGKNIADLMQREGSHPVALLRAGTFQTLLNGYNHAVNEAVKKQAKAGVRVTPNEAHLRQMRVLRFAISVLTLIGDQAQNAWKSTRIRVVGLNVFVNEHSRPAVCIDQMRQLPIGISGRPTIALDASADDVITKLTFGSPKGIDPKIVRVNIDSRPDSVRNVQVLGAPVKSGGNEKEVEHTSGLVAPIRKAVAEMVENKEFTRFRADKNVEKLYRPIWAIHRNAVAAGGAVGLVTYQIPETYYVGNNMVLGMKTMHFGALRGRDDMNAVLVNIIAGRGWLNEAEFYRLAEALFARDPEGRTPKPSAGWEKERRRRLVQLRDGSLHLIETAHHNCPIIDLVVQWYVRSELEQAIGRGRSVQRTPESPLTNFIFADFPLTVQVDAVVKWENLSPVDAFRAVLGREPDSAEDLFRGADGLFADSRDAARRAFAERGEPGTSPLLREIEGLRQPWSAAPMPEEAVPDTTPTEDPGAGPAPAAEPAKPERTYNDDRTLGRKGSLGGSVTVNMLQQAIGQVGRDVGALLAWFNENLGLEIKRREPVWRLLKTAIEMEVIEPEGAPE